MNADPVSLQLRVGLMGAGRIARLFHLPILSTLSNVEIVAVADTDKNFQPLVQASVPEATWYNHYEDLVESNTLDAVIICLPPALHAEAATASFDRGLHVYLEKPLAISAVEGLQVRSAWQKAGTVGRIGFNFRFHPLIIQMRDALREGQIGELVGVRTSFCSAARQPEDWKSRRNQGGGVLLDLGSHQFDLIRFVLGQEPVEIYAATHSQSGEEDTAVAELRLVEGQLVNVFTSISAVEQHRMEILGSDGEIVFDRYKSSRLHFNSPRREFTRTARLRAALRASTVFPRTIHDALFPPRETSFELSLRSFVRAAQGESSPGPDIDCGMKSLAIVLAAEQAARSGQKITLPKSIKEEI